MTKKKTNFFFFVLYEMAENGHLLQCVYIWVHFFFIFLTKIILISYDFRNATIPAAMPPPVSWPKVPIVHMESAAIIARYQQSSFLLHTQTLLHYKLCFLHRKKI